MYVNCQLSIADCNLLAAMSLAALRRPAVACLRTANAYASRRIPSSTSISRRSFTSLLSAPLSRPTILQPHAHFLPAPPTSSTPTLFPRTSAGTTLQVRGHRRKTYNPSHRVRKRRFGFLARMRSKTGRQVLKKRRLKGRKMLTH
ncbi:54S ribosomal protein L34 [Drechslerella dactyloides]|uniref:Large ribosomal subunit protein bL34m n=1 Tax=Drechslerella dactyloides TaxID=74499 RepID=A0AAD6J1M9_DREDA|nr:54S ribosomal protein L34 [Drechslerella dactyloides]